MGQLQEIATRFQVQLEGLKTNEFQEFNLVLRDLTRLLESELGSREITELNRRQLEQLIRSIKSKQVENLEDYIEELITSLKSLASYSYEFEAGAIVAGTTVDKVSEVTKIAALWKKVQEHPLSTDGALLDKWIDKLTNVQVTATENLIRRAYAEGWSNSTALRAFRGTRANRYTDGIVEKVGRSNETVIRTAMQHVNSVARLKVWEDNEDIVKGYRWVSTLDSRTSSTCRGLDGEEFEIGKGPLPPIHPNCRSTTVAVLDKMFEELREGLTRASATGQVRQTMTYYDWLKTQSAEFQDRVLGSKRGTLFRDGGMSVEEFTRLQLNRFFQPLTLEEMKRLKPLAFKRAGV